MSNRTAAFFRDLIDLAIAAFVLLVLCYFIALNTFNPLEAVQFHLTDSFPMQMVLVVNETVEDLVEFVKNIIY